MPTPTDALVKGIFDNVRNFILSATVIASGVFIGRHALVEESCYGLILAAVAVLLGFMLFVLNVIHGWLKFSELELPKIALLLLQTFYALIALEIVGALWEARVAL